VKLLQGVRDLEVAPVDLDGVQVKGARYEEHDDKFRRLVVRDAKSYAEYITEGEREFLRSPEIVEHWWLALEALRMEIAILRHRITKKILEAQLQRTELLDKEAQEEKTAAYKALEDVSERQEKLRQEDIEIGNRANYWMNREHAIADQRRGFQQQLHQLEARQRGHQG